MKVYKKINTLLCFTCYDSIPSEFDRDIDYSIKNENIDDSNDSTSANLENVSADQEVDFGQSFAAKVTPGIQYDQVHEHLHEYVSNDDILKK